MTTEHETQEGDRLRDSNWKRRSVIAALGTSGVFAAMASSQTQSSQSSVGIGGGPMSDELSHLNLEWYEGPESDLPSAGVEGRFFHVTSGGTNWTTGDVLRDDGNAWSRLDVGLGDARAKSVATDELDSGVGDAPIAARWHGLVTPEADGLTMSDAIDPASVASPVQDAIDLVDTNGGGVVWVPPKSINNDGGLTIPSQVTVKGLGYSLSIINITNVTTADLVTFSDTSTIANGGLADVGISGPGPTTNTGDGVTATTGYKRMDFRNVKIDGTKGAAWRLDADCFEVEHENIIVNNVDAGAVDGLIHVQKAGPGVEFDNMALYPDDSSSASDSVIFYAGYSPNNDSGSGQVTFRNANIGGSAGSILRNNNCEIAINTLNWEPSTQNSTPGELFFLNSNRSQRITGTIRIQGTCNYVYQPQGADDLFMVKPNTNGGIVNNNIIEITTDTDGPNVYTGSSGDVADNSGITLSPGVSCLGDQSIVT